MEGVKEITNLIFLQHLLLFQRLHRIDPTRIHLLHDANFAKRALADNLNCPEIGQPHLRPLQPQERSLLLAQPNQLPLLSVVGHHRISCQLSFDLHAPENTTTVVSNHREKYTDAKMDERSKRSKGSPLIPLDGSLDGNFVIMLQFQLSSLGPGQRVLREPGRSSLEVNIIGRFPRKTGRL